MQRFAIPLVIVESNYRRVEKIQLEGFSVIFGDACQSETLQAAGIGRASLLAVTAPEMDVVRTVIKAGHAANPNIQITARANNLDNIKELQDIGINESVSPECEAGLEMARQALAHLHVSAWETQSLLDKVRRDLYAPLFETNEAGGTVSAFRPRGSLLDLNWVELREGSSLQGKTIADADIRKKTGVSVVGVIRQERFYPNPLPEFILLPGDMLAIIGSAKQLQTFQMIAGV